MEYEFTQKSVRPPAAAGQFYSGSPEALRREVEQYLEAAPAYDGKAGVICAAAVPHAGYFYSAAIAAPVFKALKGASFDTIVIIGHDFGRMAPGIVAVLPGFTHYRTPLGLVEVDRGLCNMLMDRDARIIRNDR
ncbi:MAG: AmmeMemoRadiSam system protein B, partial [Lentisphaeria bacterium]|nr:AmmeMemoRadiSam system protein B [Lentisphaeria bacterium]